MQTIVQGTFEELPKVARRLRRQWFFERVVEVQRVKSGRFFEGISSPLPQIPF